MKHSVSTASGVTIYAGDVIRLPWGEDKHIVYATFYGVCGSTKRTTSTNRTVIISDILDGDEVLLGECVVRYRKSIPFTKATDVERKQYLDRIRDEKIRI